MTTRLAKRIDFVCDEYQKGFMTPRGSGNWIDIHGAAGRHSYLDSTVRYSQYIPFLSLKSVLCQSRATMARAETKMPMSSK
jgi:hypothetical protein